MAQAARNGSGLSLVGRSTAGSSTPGAVQPESKGDEQGDQREDQPGSDDATPAAAKPGRLRKFWNAVSGNNPHSDGDGSRPQTDQGGHGGGNRRRLGRVEVTARVVQGAVMVILGVALGASILSLGDANMLYLLPVLIGALALCSQGWLYMTTAEEPRKHDPNARRQAGAFQLVLGFAMALAMLKYGNGDKQLVVLGYTSGFLIFVFGWKLYFQRPVARTD